VDDELAGIDAQDLTRTADRLTALADTAELMGDLAGAARFHEMAAALRLHAMGLLDD
jgi:hypothetical protein